MKLNMRRKYKRRLPSRIKEPLLQPIMPNITWWMDFMHDSLQFGKTFRSFNVIDDFNREALNITIDTSLNSKRVVREFDQLIDWRGKPEKLVSIMDLNSLLLLWNNGQTKMILNCSLFKRESPSRMDISKDLIDPIALKFLMLTPSII
jgi:transposase InsO family protein